MGSIFNSYDDAENACEDSINVPLMTLGQFDQSFGAKYYCTGT